MPGKLSTGPSKHSCGVWQQFPPVSFDPHMPVAPSQTELAWNVTGKPRAAAAAHPWAVLPPQTGKASLWQHPFWGGASHAPVGPQKLPRENAYGGLLKFMNS